MQADQEQPAIETEPNGGSPPARGSRVVDWLIVLAIGVILASVYAPLLIWLGHTTFTLAQLHNGGLIVLFALVVSLRRAVRSGQLAPEANFLGIALVAVGLGSLYLLRWAPGLALPLALLSFCLAFAGVSAFLFGRSGPRLLLPAMAGILILGLLAGLAPSLDWPLRAMAAKYSAAFLRHLGVHVVVALQAGRPPQLVLAVGNRLFVVAAECNGFGLLASSLLVAAILALYYRLSWLDKALLLLLAVPLAIAFNAFRIVGICLAATHVPLPYAVIHEGVGVIFYASALAILWWLAVRRSAPEAEPQRVQPKP